MLSGKNKNHSSVGVCGDCGRIDPLWVSLNRGILICNDCCSVHRSLGRHISQVKCLKHATWIPSQLAMIQSLYACGANNVWEYCLLDPNNSKTGRKKPTPSDPVHPVKSEFIFSKHKHLDYVYRPGKDDANVTDSELSKQLHSSVRTPNLETSLRILLQGADPNYFHPEKNSTPLQVACRAGQASQVELLLVYGADPGAVDRSGETATDYAERAGHAAIAARVVEAQYELTDSLSHFISRQRPDHTSGRHFLIPAEDRGAGGDDTGRRKLRLLSDAVFEELVCDLYDEIDRRESDGIWKELHRDPEGRSTGVPPPSLPFLPVNTEYSSTRNQERQKLGRMNHREMTCLVVDSLREIYRRQFAESPLGPEANGVVSLLPRGNAFESDDEPLYDSVCSDDDYYFVPEETPLEAAELPTRNSDSNDSAEKVVGKEDYERMQRQLENSEQNVKLLLRSNECMKSEIATLNAKVDRLLNIREREDLPHLEHSRIMNDINDDSSYLFSGVSPGVLNKMPPPYSHIRSRSPGPILGDERPASREEPYGAPARYDLHTGYEERHGPVGAALPSQEEVHRRTRIVTHRIQSLLVASKRDNLSDFMPCSVHIISAVANMIEAFPEEVDDPAVVEALSRLGSATAQFETETHLLDMRSKNEPLSQNFIIQQVIQYAFNIAKATKQLVELFQ